MENFEFQIAEQFVNNTATHIFLTGKAGTGKTTFLRQVLKNAPKKNIIVAPTGVAAINAGGVTIHSMFGLPTKSFIPSNDDVDPNLANNQEMLSRHFHYHRDKLDVILELELLVIDEVSMVRADILDAMDFTLRYVRRNNKPFGGVQVLFIGDMYQLPPVVKDEEWPLLSRYYNSPYFFDSQVFKTIDPVYVELRKIYRQTDNFFIRILNNIRNQDFQQEDYEALHELYNPEFEPDEPGYITLTTHNRKADAINEKELARLEGEQFGMDAEVSGDFSDSMFPTERLLRLKIGAQVMFVKNDTTGGKYYNGKIGIVETIDYSEGVGIRFPDSGEKILVKQELWENIRYSVNAEQNKLEQNRIGSFKQYPLRLAWAITIHKSQGLTFDKAVIDAGESFAPGQVYVALSRCTSMDHLVLKSIITGRNIFCDPRIVDFSSRIMKDIVLENRLVTDSKRYELDSLVRVFEFGKLEKYIRNWDKNVSKIKSVERRTSSALTRATLDAVAAMDSTAQKFIIQLNQIIGSGASEAERSALLRERLEKAIHYFGEKMHSELIVLWNDHYEAHRKLSKLKKYLRETHAICMLLEAKWEMLYETQLDGSRIVPETKEQKSSQSTTQKSSNGPAKGETYVVSLEMFREGKSMEEIARERGMALSTIEGHMGKWVAQGELSLDAFISPEKAEKIKEALAQVGGNSLGAVKARLGDDVTFGEIRMVQQAGSNLKKEF